MSPVASKFPPAYGKSGIDSSSGIAGSVVFEEPRSGPTPQKNDAPRHVIVKPPNIDQPALAYTEAAMRVAMLNAPIRRQWQTGMFDFVRMLKSHPKIGCSDAKGVMGWLSQNFGTDWAKNLGLLQDDAEGEMVDLWHKIRLHYGTSPIAMAVAHAASDPLELPEELNLDYRADVYRRFISTCAWFCVVLDQRTITIPCVMFAKEMNVSSMTVSRLRNQAVEDGFMRLTKKHNHKQGIAAQYHFKTHHWGQIEEQMSEADEYTQN